METKPNKPKAQNKEKKRTCRETEGKRMNTNSLNSTQTRVQARTKEKQRAIIGAHGGKGQASVDQCDAEEKQRTRNAAAFGQQTYKNKNKNKNKNKKGSKDEVCAFVQRHPLQTHDAFKENIHGIGGKQQDHHNVV